MKTNLPTIDIFRENSQLKSISVVMPLWDKVGIDDSIVVNIPLFGLKTYVFDDIDENKAIEDAIKTFCKNCEEYGKGLEVELSHLGWSLVNKDYEKVTMLFNISDKDIVIEQIMDTGEKQARVLELA